MPLRWLPAAAILALGHGCSGDDSPPPAPIADGDSSAGQSTSSTGTGADDTTGGTATIPSDNPLEGAGPVELIADGFTRAEGPVWRANEGDLLFTDVAADTIHRLVLPDTVEVFRGPTEPPSFTNGLALSPSGNLVACEGGAQRVTRGNAAEQVVATMWMDSVLNSPNDVAVHSNGGVYFTDPTYGTLPDFGGVMTELDFQGVYLAPAEGGLSLVGDALLQPNGIALSPAEDILYVSDTEAGAVYAFGLAPDGLIEGEAMLVNDQSPQADGLTVDAAGNVYIATANGVLVIARDDDDAAWGGIELPEPATNVEFGGPNLTTLYVTTTTALYSVELLVAGLP